MQHGMGGNPMMQNQVAPMPQPTIAAPAMPPVEEDPELPTFDPLPDEAPEVPECEAFDRMMNGFFVQGPNK